MSDCKHEWMGVTDGVTCRKCGAHLSNDEFIKLVTKQEPSAEDKPKRGRKAKHE
jgi:hypothetical protein